jgi:predicted flap endonuclease-1-like 5' DNA nuclease
MFFMGVIPMTDIHSMLVRKKQELSTYYELAKEALEAHNIPQAQKFSNNGLHQAQIENDKNWIERFNSLNYNLTQPTQNLTPSATKEDLTKIKGIGLSVAQQLNGIGIDSLNSLVEANVERIATIKGIGAIKAQKIHEEAKILLTRKNLNDFTNSKDAIKTPIPQQEDAGKIVETKYSQQKWFDDKFKRPKTNMWSKPPPKLRDNTPTIYPIEGVLDELEDDDTDIKIMKEVDKVEEFIVHQNTLLNQTDISTGIMQSPIVSGFLEPDDKQVQTPLPFSRIERPPSEIEAQISHEVLSNQEIDQNKLNILNILESREYTTIDRIPPLQKITAGIDLLTIKRIPISDHLDLLYIFPIKLIDYKGPLIASAIGLKYANEGEEGLMIAEQLNSSLKLLERVQHAIFTDLTTEDTLATYLKTVLKVDLTIEKSLIKKSLMFRTGHAQHKVIITPIIISANTVGFEEKIVPFAYQKPTNTYILQISRLPELLAYIEKKYSLLEKYCFKKSAAERYSYSKNNSFEVLRKFSIPFIGFGAVFLFTILFQLISFLDILTNIGYACIGIYFLLIGYVFVQVFSQQVHLHQEFKKPYHRREISFDETSLILINEELSSLLMNQFVYECLPGPSQYKIINSLEQNTARDALKKKRYRTVIHNKHFFEKKEEIPFSSDSFSSFLEE